MRRELRARKRFLSPLGTEANASLGRMLARAPLKSATGMDWLLVRPLLNRPTIGKLRVFSKPGGGASAPPSLRFLGRTHAPKATPAPDPIKGQYFRVAEIILVPPTRWEKPDFNPNLT